MGPAVKNKKNADARLNYSRTYCRRCKRVKLKGKNREMTHDAF